MTWFPQTGPSPHLSWKELACRDGTSYPVEWRKDRAVKLAVEFERIRAAVGGRILIGSAYRTEAWNKKVGGVKWSQHRLGLALDLYPPEGMFVAGFFNIIRQIADDPKSAVYGVGLYPTFVHFDCRQTPNRDRLAIWNGSRISAERKNV